MIKTLKRYFSIFKGVKLPWFLIALSLVISFVDAQVGVQSIEISASIIDASRNAISSADLMEYVFYLLLTGICAVFDTYFSNLAYEKINMGVRIKLWNKIMRLPTKYYDEDNGNELVSRVTVDTSSSSFYFEVAVSTITSIYSAVVIFIKLFEFEPTLAAWTLLIFPVVFGIGGIYGFMNYHASFRVNKTFAGTTGYLTEHVRNFRMIKAFNMQQFELKIASKLFHKQFKAETFQEMTVAVIQLGIQLINCACIVIAFVFGGKMVAEGQLTIGRLVAFYTLAGSVSVNLMNLYMNFGAFTSVNGSIEKISHIFTAEEEEKSGKNIDEEDKDIVFENVSFSYGNAPVLNNLSFTVPKGKTTALIGVNGAGKSTVIKLLERMYNPSEGTVRFGDTDIREISLADWRNAFGWVAQGSPLLSGTVRENILYGVEREVSEEEMIEAAKLANAYDFIMETPDGFDAEVGPDGSNFSGGQRQCIAIARALMRNPRYLLLDEATSNLDVNSENCVTCAFARLMQNRTTLMIAHNYAATKMADYVIVMNNGAVEAEGTPEELLKTNEYYRTFAGSADEKEIVCKR